MKVTLELEEGEEGCFEKASFLVSVEQVNLFSLVVGKVNQFLYPFVTETPTESLKAAFLEMLEGSDQDMLVEAMELPKWETSDIVKFKELLDKELSSRST